MHKKYLVRLADEERGVCQPMIKKLTGASQTFRRAHILLKADADGPGWLAIKIAEACNCRVQTIEPVRQRRVTAGLARALHGQQRQAPPTRPQRDGAAEAPWMALRLGNPPAGDGPWTLPWRADALVALEVVESISHATVRQTLKKRA